MGLGGGRSPNPMPPASVFSRQRGESGARAQRATAGGACLILQWGWCFDPDFDSRKSFKSDPSSCYNGWRPCVDI